MNVYIKTNSNCRIVGSLEWQKIVFRAECLVTDIV